MMRPDSSDTTSIRTLPVPLLLVDGGDAGVRSINRAARSALGYRDDAQTALSLHTLFPRVSPLELARLLDSTVIESRPPQQWLMRRPDGSDSFTEVLIAPHDSRAGNEWVFALRDLSDQSAAADGLQRLREGVADLREAIMVLHPLPSVDHAVRCLFVNAAFEALTGWSNDEVVARSPSVLDGADTSMDALRRFRKAMAAGTPIRTELLSYRRDHTAFWVEIDAVPIRDVDGEVSHWIVNHRDVTVRRQLEEQIFRTQKLDAVGRLASGVAHDFNNVLTAIGGFTDMLLTQLTRGSTQHEEALQIRHGADRAVALTRQLLVFGREQSARPANIDLNATITDLERLLRRVISERVSIRTILTVPLPAVFADRNQIEQVLLNLVMNASEAMLDGGTVTIETGTIAAESASAADVGSASTGQQVVLTVADTGIGMSAATRERIFEPFFTTKATGTGLGLSVVQGIVRRSGGEVVAESTLDHGSTFRVLFPASSAAAEVVDDRALAVVPGGSETVLVVEDDAAVRHVTRAMLARRGYIVLVARDSEEAERVSYAYGGAIDLLLCDVVLPRRSGQYVADRLLVGRPTMRVLFMSGYSEDVILDQHILSQHHAMLEKPFSEVTLATRVRTVLDQRA